MRRFATAVLGVLLVFSVVGATPGAATSTQASAQTCSFPVTMTDATGTEITLEERPERVTTTNPSAAQTMWEIGGREQVVGLTKFASYLEGAESRTNVSAGFGVSVEKVVGTNPDLVIAPNASAGDVAGLREAGLTVYHLPASTSVEDIRQKTTTIGRLTGNCQGAAEANAWMTRNVDAVRDTTAGIDDRKTVLYPLGGGYVAANGTFIDTLLDVAGADNVAARNNTGYPELSNEVLLQLDPEVLVVTEQTAGLVDEEPYASTTAGETNATVRLRVRDLNQPAPRSVVNTVHDATRQLYPERYDEESYVPRSAVENETSEQQTTQTATATASDGTTTTGGNGPGFTAVGALVSALAVAALVGRRR
ncbi:MULTISPECIES: PGF-CTERM-anchored ABC transporter substrate-binding protein [Haloarcula]|uniref:Cobalamin-binding protein n=1 Tax=Haloarcula pellucida TaxID=1427151 RepID=A0A830GKA6_9EURY|nr:MULTISPECIES: PGF-CTERM-anchored ABC transporter substrate-binding protein [Halomicroarcula]MBX0348433.1 helical backbone metal receptor [Halomicroarcula pellucida]MDS0278257.1 PGF-CTERM-anchored ABC transporter substrate-binding protein [Halomicroarcula sp. S1AR25-4]GGN93367.1 cobalamin-binding protein [Halomicroarcula pellucida]